MTNVGILQIKLESVIENSQKQSLLFEDEALQCYKNNMKWIIDQNLSMKKLADNSFVKPEIKPLSLKKIDTVSTTFSETNCQNTTICQNGGSNLNFCCIKTKLAHEIEKLQQNKQTDCSKFSNYPNFSQLHNALRQLPQSLVETQKNAIIDQVNLENYNNWKQITIENSKKIDNELEKQQRKNLIMDQLESLKREKEAFNKQYNEISENNSFNLEKTKKPVVLNLSSNLASKKIMTKISSFASQVSNILTRDQK